MLEWLEVRRDVRYEKRSCMSTALNRWIATEMRWNKNAVLFLIQDVIIIIIFALVLHSKGFKIGKCKNVCPKWLRWGIGNCERDGKARCVETLNCHGNTLVQERGFSLIGYAEGSFSADFCNEAVSLVWQGTKSLYRHISRGTAPRLPWYQGQVIGSLLLLLLLFWKKQRNAGVSVYLVTHTVHLFFISLWEIPPQKSTSDKYCQRTVSTAHLSALCSPKAGYLMKWV